MAVLDPNGKAFVYSVPALRFEGQIARDTPITRIAISPSSGYMATAHADGSVYTWDLTTRRALGQTLAVGNITALALSDLGDVLAIADDAGIVWLWNSPLVTPQSQPLAALEVPAGVATLEFSAQSTMLIARDAAGKVLAVWQVKSA
jgi:WD40 repeat protein